jgi:hypothetical protein
MYLYVDYFDYVIKYMLLCLIDVRSNEFYIIIFLNKLKIVENAKKNKKTPIYG